MHFLKSESLLSEATDAYKQMTDILRISIHFSLHVIAPGAIAYLFFRQTWMRSWAIMLATMLVDLDHLFATPVFDPNRCSIGFHPLHSYTAICCYLIFVFPTFTRIAAIGLLFHMLTDMIDWWIR